MRMGISIRRESPLAASHGYLQSNGAKPQAAVGDSYRAFCNSRIYMKTPLSIATILFSTTLLASLAPAQSTPNSSKDSSNSRLVTYMMSFDAKHDGKLTRDEITDTRMLRFFDLADANKDGVVTKDELAALAAKLETDLPASNGRGGPGGPGAGPGGFDDGGPPGRGRGPGGRGMMGGPPRPGQVLPPMAQQMLNLTDDQKKQVDELQKEVDAKLAKILTPQQLDQLKQMPGRGPGGRGGFGPGGPGGPPPQDR